MKKTNVTFLTHAAMIAALYVVLTFLANALGLASGAIQIRFSEALTVLPFFTSAAVPGLFIGCIISNLLTGCMPLDIIFGSLATLIGAYATYLIGKKCHYPLSKWLSPIPPILSNTLIIPFILAFVYHFEGSLFYFFVTVFLGEVISCYLLGMILFHTIYKYRNILFRYHE